MQSFPIQAECVNTCQSMSDINQISDKIGAASRVRTCAGNAHWIWNPMGIARASLNPKMIA